MARHSKRIQKHSNRCTKTGIQKAFNRAVSEKPDCKDRPLNYGAESPAASKREKTGSPRSVIIRLAFVSNSFSALVKSRRKRTDSRSGVLCSEAVFPIRPACASGCLPPQAYRRQHVRVHPQRYCNYIMIVPVYQHRNIIVASRFLMEWSPS